MAICLCFLIQIVYIPSVYGNDDQKKDLGEMLVDMTGWTGSPGKLVFGDKKLTVNGSNGIAGYTAETVGNEGLTFKVIPTFDPHDGWVAFSLRSANPSYPLWDSGHNYTVLIKGDGDIELQKWLGTSQMILAVNSDGLVGPGQSSSIMFGAYDEGDDVRILLEVNGEIVIDYLDQDNPITEKGYFSCMVYQNSSAVLVGTEEGSDSDDNGIEYGEIKHKDAAMTSLLEQERWFSLPTSGIAHVKADADQVVVSGQGSVAYKNKLTFEKLSFDFKGDFEDDSESMFMFQFNKNRRGSYYNQLHTVDYSNYSYGLTFNRSGQIELVKMANKADGKTLLVVPSALDFTETQRINLEMEEVEKGIVEFRLYLNESEEVYAVRDEQYGGNYTDGGFIGITNINHKCRVTLTNIEIVGEEEETNLGLEPAPIYLLDYFEEEGRRFIHWKYNDGDHNYTKVLIRDDKNELVDIVKYPADMYVINDKYQGDELVVTPVNVDSNEGVSKSIKLKVIEPESLVTESERIGVWKNEPNAYFYGKDTGNPFEVKGVNFVRLRFGDHVTLEAATNHYPSGYDPYDVETMMRTLKEEGYNTVRVFVIGRYNMNPGIAGNPDTQGVYGPYMDNFIDLLQKARKHGLYVMPSMGDGELPISPYYQNMIKGVKGFKNGIYLTEEGIKAKQQYLQEFLTYIKEEDDSLLKTMIGVQLQNEMYMDSDRWPFNLEEGTIKGANGKTYNMADADERQMLMEEGTNHYHNQMVAAIKEIDPELLVSEGVFTRRAVGKEADSHKGLYPGTSVDSRFPPTATVLGNSDLDFIDIHIYHSQAKDSVPLAYKRSMASMNFYSDEMALIRQSKPVIMGEFGSFVFMEPTFDEAVTTILKLRDMAVDDGLAGIMVWTYDTFEQKDLHHAMGDDGLLLKKIADFNLDLKSVVIEKTEEPVAVTEDVAEDSDEGDKSVDDSKKEEDNGQKQDGKRLPWIAGLIIAGALVVWGVIKKWFSK